MRLSAEAADRTNSIECSPDPIRCPGERMTLAMSFSRGSFRRVRRGEMNPEKMILECKNERRPLSPLLS